MKPKVLRRKNNKTFDNEKDAYNYALTLLNYRDYSIAEIKNTLQKRSVDDEIINEVAGLVEADAEIERCCAAADSYIKKKKINSFEDAMKVKAGLGRFLFARGFSVDLIKKTIAEKISYSGVDNYD